MRWPGAMRISALNQDIWRNQSELLHEAEDIGVVPSFFDPAIEKAIDRDARNRQTLARFRNTHQRAAFMRGAVGPTPYDAVSFGDNVVNDESAVRKSAMKVPADLFERIESQGGGARGA